jgi:signal transduction histidine kinase
MDIRTQSALLASIVGLALGLSMLLRAERLRVSTLYALFAFTVGGFYLAQFFHHLALSSSLVWPARMTGAFILIVGALVPSAALSFFLEFLGVSRKLYRRGQRAALLSAVFGVAVGVSPLSQLMWARVGLAVWVFGALSVSVSLVVRKIRQSDSSIERARLMYLAWGAGASMVFAALDFLVRFDIPFPPLGALVVTLYLFFLAQTLLRLRLMDLHELLGKVASLSVLAAILVFVIATLTGWVGVNLPLFLFNTVVASFVILILLDPLRTKVEERTVAIFFRERFELLRKLSNLRARISNLIDINELSGVVLDALNETRRVTHCSIYVLSEDRPGYRLLDSRGPQPVGFLHATTVRGLLHFAAAGQKAVLLENLERRVAEIKVRTIEGKRLRDELRRLAETRAALTQMKSGVCVPLLGGDQVIGFLNLWDERVPEAFASDEIALVLDIAERISTVVENSKLYEKMRERDRLAALGEMAAGLAHEIRNPLGAIKGAAQCLNPSRLTGEDSEFLDVIIEEVNRLNGVVTAFLDYSRPLKQNFGPTDLNEVVTRTVRLIQNEIPRNIELKVELTENLNKVEADAEQLKQVLINLVQNAIQAMGGAPGTLTLSTSRPERFGHFANSEMVELSVSDTGPGIPADQQPHIFVPFFTTKRKGTGLGLAICQRILKNHGGTISLQSRLGEGSTFTLRMPALPSEASATPFPGTLQRPVALSAEAPAQRARRAGKAR